MRNRPLLLGVVLSSVVFSVADAQAQYFPPGDPKAADPRPDADLPGQGGSAPRDFLPTSPTWARRTPRNRWTGSTTATCFWPRRRKNGEATSTGATNRTDWQYYLDELLFKKGRSLDALETCIRDVEKTLGPRGRKTPVIIMIPYPSQAMKDFGDVDGDGRSEDLSQPADRLKAVRWCVDEILRRWERAGLSTLSLWGFYWMNEGIGPQDEAIVRATADFVHQRGYGLHWIPYYSAPGYDKLPQLGIDFAVLQPNYAFMEQNGQRPQEQRLEDTARKARQWRMGIEIEMVSELSTLSERNNLWDYLTHGRRVQRLHARGSRLLLREPMPSPNSVTASRLPTGPSTSCRISLPRGPSAASTVFSRHAPYRIHDRVVPEYPDDAQKLTDGRLAAALADTQRLVGLSGDCLRSRSTWATCVASRGQKSASRRRSRIPMRPALWARPADLGSRVRSPSRRLRRGRSGLRPDTAVVGVPRGATACWAVRCATNSRPAMRGSYASRSTSGQRTSRWSTRWR